MIAVGKRNIRPAELVAETVVEAAYGAEIVLFGGATIGAGLAMIDVARESGHTTSGEDTGAVPRLDVAALTPVGPASGDPVVEGLPTAGVGDREAPLGVKSE